MLCLLHNSAFYLFHFILPWLLLVRREQGLILDTLKQCFPSFGVRDPSENLVTSITPLPETTCIQTAPQNLAYNFREFIELTPQTL